MSPKIWDFTMCLQGQRGRRSRRVAAVAVRLRHSAPREIEFDSIVRRFWPRGRIRRPSTKCTYNEQTPVFEALPLQYVRSSTPEGRPPDP